MYVLMFVYNYPVGCILSKQFDKSCTAQYLLLSFSVQYIGTVYQYSTYTPLPEIETTTSLKHANFWIPRIRELHTEIGILSFIFPHFFLERDLQFLSPFPPPLSVEWLGTFHFHSVTSFDKRKHKVKTWHDTCSYWSSCWHSTINIATQESKSHYD